MEYSIANFLDNLFVIRNTKNGYIELISNLLFGVKKSKANFLYYEVYYTKKSMYGKNTTYDNKENKPAITDIEFYKLINNKQNEKSTNPFTETIDRFINNEIQRKNPDDRTGEESRAIRFPCTEGEMEIRGKDSENEFRSL